MLCLQRGTASAPGLAAQRLRCALPACRSPRVRVKLLTSTRGQGAPALTLWPSVNTAPLPVYWTDFTSPIFLIVASRTALGILGNSVSADGADECDSDDNLFVHWSGLLGTIWKVSLRRNWEGEAPAKTVWSSSSDKQNPLLSVSPLSASQGGESFHFVGGGPLASTAEAAPGVNQAGYQRNTFPVRLATKSSPVGVAVII